MQDCVDWVLSGAKPASQFRIGTEFERFLLGPDGRVLPYEGRVSIRTVLERLAIRHGWTPYLEGGNPTALTRGMASVSLEPAGQFELSGAPFATSCARNSPSTPRRSLTSRPTWRSARRTSATTR
jgi:glutamate--cysteine ligase